MDEAGVTGPNLGTDAAALDRTDRTERSSRDVARIVDHTNLRSGDSPSGDVEKTELAASYITCDVDERKLHPLNSARIAKPKGLLDSGHCPADDTKAEPRLDATEVSTDVAANNARLNPTSIFTDDVGTDTQLKTVEPIATPREKVDGHPWTAALAFVAAAYAHLKH